MPKGVRQQNEVFVMTELRKERMKFLRKRIKELTQERSHLLGVQRAYKVELSELKAETKQEI